MPPRHRKGIADAVNPPEPDDSRKQIAEKDLLDRAGGTGGRDLRPCRAARYGCSLGGWITLAVRLRTGSSPA
jgi:hypothetical protein